MESSLYLGDISDMKKDMKEIIVTENHLLDDAVERFKNKLNRNEIIANNFKRMKWLQEKDNKSKVPPERKK